MLLVHQAGSVKVGEVVRYTLTYTPSSDRILPSPSHLHLKIKNTSAIPLRAAYLHGPYTLHVSAYPSTFNPNVKVEDDKDGIPEFEPLLKAGGHWSCKLTVPESIRESGASLAGSHRHHRTSFDQVRHDDKKEPASATWVIEVASQILFSNSAVVHFEVLVGRDERSLDLGFAAVAGHGHGAPAQVHDHLKDRKRDSGSYQKGVYSRAVKLVVEDTDALWDKPALPTKEHDDKKAKESEKRDTESKDKTKKKKKIHLVVLTHGLHSNLGADMLYMKESIDATVKQARLDARKRKAAYNAENQPNTSTDDPEQKSSAAGDGDDTAHAAVSGGQEDLQDDDNDGDDDEEQTIVRGFTGNAVRTERGIQYLGKRLAKFVFDITYPDQPFQYVKKSMAKSFTNNFKSKDQKEAQDGPPSHGGSSIHFEDSDNDDLPYTFTSISFIGHSLGGLIQTYAIAYIHKHAPHFFEQIKPINFICMASPLLGLSNENPMYVRFALDFGLVGRTGQDLGLTWRAPNIARSGWSAMVGGFGAGQKEQKHEDPGAKPLLRILPTGPAHYVLHLFRNRTVYSNVVNDGIVPLRTSCLLFLDWRGLDKVEKARRENGLIGTLAEFGWAEIMGNNALAGRTNKTTLPSSSTTGEDASGTDTSTRNGDDETVPQPHREAMTHDNRDSVRTVSHTDSSQSFGSDDRRSSKTSSDETQASNQGVFGGLMNFFRPTPQQQQSSKKVMKAVRRGQTVQKDEATEHQDELKRRESIGRKSTDNPTMRSHRRPPATRGDSLINDPTNVQAPPRTSIFESASDLLHPPIPSTAWIIDPSSRSRTIFHDRVYHPEDIPPPPIRRPTRLSRSFSSDSPSFGKNKSLDGGENTPDAGSMKVEEKIARAYHKDLSWRKVLVRLEPDAHNNMIVRRMFANAYGWPVVKHLCDTHFADTLSATTRDDDEPSVDRAQGAEAQIGDRGEEVEGQSAKKRIERSGSETRERQDELGALRQSQTGADKHKLHPKGSAVWDDIYFEGTDDDDDDEEDGYAAQVRRFIKGATGAGGHAKHGTTTAPKHETQDGRMAPLSRKRSVSADGHRGLGPTSRYSSGSHAEAVLSPGMANGEFAPRLSEEPSSMHSEGHAGGKGKQSTAEVGLKRSVGDGLSSSMARDGDDEGVGVTEQVALLSSPKGRGG